MQRPCLTLLLIISLLPLFAQKPVVRAQEEMELFHYQNAITILKREIQKNPGESPDSLSYLLARCYMLVNLPDSALPWFEQAIGHDSTAWAERGGRIPCDYAEALRMCGQYQQAKKWFLRCSSTFPELSHYASKAVACDSAIGWLKKPPRFAVQPVPSLNSPQSEFGVTPLGKDIIFASDRVPADKRVKVYAWTGHAYLSLYQSARSDTNSPVLWEAPSQATIHRKYGWHEGPVSFSKTGDLACLNRSQATTGKQKEPVSAMSTGQLKIFFSQKTQGEWNDPVPFYLNNDAWSVGHPALSVTGDTLYFVSDMPGGKGETDIYYCNNHKGTWSNPVPVGDHINTSGREMFPCPSGGGRLYFASDGLPGYGGLDLYYAFTGKDASVVPINLGHPVNSPRDDFAISTQDGLTGYFSSDRPGGMGSDDIYFFTGVTYPDSLPLIARDDQTGNPVISDNQRQTPHDSLVFGKTYRLDNIHYDFDRWEIRDDAIPSLDNLVRIMKENPLTIELSSHTDCRGSGDYNLVLSQKRAASAVDYLADHGIDRRRMIAKGYGESRLVNACDCVTRISCREQEHQENRRTEFKITGLFLNHE